MTVLTTVRISATMLASPEKLLEAKSRMAVNEQAPKTTAISSARCLVSLHEPIKQRIWLNHGNVLPHMRCRQTTPLPFRISVSLQTSVSSVEGPHGFQLTAPGKNTTTRSSSAADTMVWSTPPILRAPGKKFWCLERRHVLGGAAVTEEVFPGFKFSVCSYVVSLLRPEIIRELDLPRHGLEILPLDGTFTPMPNGDYLWRVNDHAQHSSRNRASLETRCRSLRRIRQGHDRDGPLREADHEHDAARSHVAQSEGF